ncbi:MAG TPA: hypothetical protein VEY12_03245 [Thermoplasmata archaeon]|nr:hypothetical protein [Thermoplasmata archaeon]
MASPAIPEHRHGLSFLATLAFTAGFFGARIFHLTFPETMIFFGDIHFHHFWYGLAMMGVSGWLGIAVNDLRYNRIYALVFGLGAGFVGDEVGLLLTGGDYYSVLTFDFFIVAVAAIILIALLLRYRKEIEADILRASPRERLVLLGVFLAGFSTILFGYPFLGLPLLVVGGLLVLWGLFLRHRSGDERSPEAQR